MPAGFHVDGWKQIVPRCIGNLAQLQDYWSSFSGTLTSLSEAGTPLVEINPSGSYLKYDPFLSLTR